MPPKSLDGENVIEIISGHKQKREAPDFFELKKLERIFNEEEERQI